MSVSSFQTPVSLKAASRVSAGSKTNDEEDDDLTNTELWQTLHSQLTNMAKSFTCPICQSTYQSPVVLPCLHAYCQSCISQALKQNRQQCPTCCQPCNRRSLTPSPLLAQAVHCHKQIMRSLGFTPIAYDAGLNMTQLPPSPSPPSSPAFELPDDPEREQGGAGSNQKSLRECHLHLQVSKTWQRVLRDLPAKEDKRGVVEKLRQERDRVVVADESAVLKAAVQKRKRSISRERQREAEKPTAEQEQEKNEKAAVVVEEEEVEKKQPQQNREKKKKTVTTRGRQTRGRTRSQRMKKMKRATKNLADDDATETDDEFEFPGDMDEANPFEDEETTLSDDDDDDAAETESTNLAVTLNKGTDGSTEKDKRVALDGGKTEEQSNNENRNESNSSTPTDHEIVDDDDDGHETEDVAAISPSSTEDNETSQAKAINAAIALAELNHGPTTAPVFSVSDIVHVASRTWPGINKPGGVGRITKVHEENGSVMYDVNYVLGGKEKKVGSAFVTKDETSTEEEMGEQQQQQGQELVRSRRVSSRNKHAGSEIPLAVLEALEAEGFETGRTTMKKAKATKRKPPNSPTKASKKSPIRKENQRKGILERNKGENGIEEQKTTRTTTTTPSKRRRYQGTPSEPSHKKPKVDVGPISFPEIDDGTKYDLADKYYHLQYQKANDESIINIVASGLPDYDKAMLSQLARMTKKQDVNIKVTESFNPKKTTMAIIPVDDRSDDVSRLRTLKVMRAALAGIPIVSSAWISLCIEKDKVVAPDSSMFIRTLSSKTDELVSGESDVSLVGGVALQAARMQQKIDNTIPERASTLPLRNFQVQLCGAFKSPKKSDVQILLRESGASVSPSCAVTSKLIQSPLFSKRRTIVVLLCDESASNGSCGITAEFAKQIKVSMRSHPGRILVANPHWLFDTISCGVPAPSEHYKPKSSRARDLWMSCS